MSSTSGDNDKMLAKMFFTIIAQFMVSSAVYENSHCSFPKPDIVSFKILAIVVGK